MTTEEFYNQLYNLAHISRYSTVPRIRSESVAEHSFFVASLVIKLHDDYKFDLGKAVVMATIHDWTESWVDDITIKTKRNWPAIAEAVAQAEEWVATSYFSDEVYHLWKEHVKHQSVESLVVKYADTLQVVQYASNEILMGNKGYMQEVKDAAEFNANMLEGALYEHKK